MSAWPECPTVYEINTWVWLRELGHQQGRPVTLGSVPQAELERLASYRFDALWLMGVWQRSPAGREVARMQIDLHTAYSAALPDCRLEDVVGSPYAVLRYQVDPVLGDDAELQHLRERLRRLGLRLMLDFVPNHVALDHPWLSEHPERPVQGSRDDLLREPWNYFESQVSGQSYVLAHGRDPYFPGWTDTVQLDYRRAETRQAMAELLRDLAERCDGVRCDMAMLVNLDVFRRTWGGDFEPPDAEFWPRAISRAKASNPNFLLLAEVYWDLEYRLQQLGFDYTYDKRLYDHLRDGDLVALRAHLRADPAYQRRLAHFVENHDEPRALTVFGSAHSLAAATLALTLPGLRLVHEGQLEGRRVKLPVQLGRRPLEPAEPGFEPFYRQLLAALAEPVMRSGDWSLLEPPTGANPAAASSVIIQRWSLGLEHRLVVINLSPQPVAYSQPLDLPALTGHDWILRDLLGDLQLTRTGDRLLDSGLDLDLPGWGRHLFELRPAATQPGAITGA